MLLAIDVGNTNISFGVLDDARLVLHLRSSSVVGRTTDEYVVLVKSLLELRGVPLERIDGSIIASVVPALTDTMIALVEALFEQTPIVVGPGVKTGMPILYEDPRDVGADRIVNAVAAYAWAQGGAIVVDFGTATTFDCVSPAGEYLGGAIAPGIQISAEALFGRAARLRRVEIARPTLAVGRNTGQSMQSGIVFGYAGLVDGLCRRLQQELSFPCRIVSTGGLAALVGPETETIEQVDPNLTLTGLRLVYERNRHAGKRS
jgi:type III pantothenate kinase